MDTVSLADLSPSLPSVSAPPMDALPLAQMLGGRKSQSLPVIRAGEMEHSGTAYEIELEPEPLPPPLPLAVALAPPPRPVPSRSVPPPAPRPELPPLPPELPALPSNNETDFSDVMTDAPAPAPKSDELDFSGLMDDEPQRSARTPLPRIPLFSSLQPDELEQLIAGVEVRDFQPGEVIVRQGEQGVALYVVVQGQVEVVVERPERVQVATLGEGAFFGELALLTDFPRAATVQAIEPTQTLEISRELIARVIADSPDVLKVLLRFFRDRLLDRFLSTSNVFQHFSVEDARALMERFKFLEIEPSTRVIREGERATGLYLLLCGEVAVVRGKEPIARLQPGDVFGEMSLLNRGPAVASIDTVTKCWALQLQREDFQEIILTYPQLLEFIAELAEKRRTQNQPGPDRQVDLL